MEKVDKNSILSQIDALPPFPATVTKILQLANNPASLPKDIIQAISLDPVITAKVLKMINSAYFGVPNTVVSLTRAVVMLGLNSIKNIAIGSAVVSGIKMKAGFKWFSNDEFWEHCLGCAVGAKMLAEKAGIPAKEREEYFVAGLLHDIGKIIFVLHYSDEFEHILDPSFSPGEIRPVLEAKEFGIDHAELGSEMAKRWKLPTILSEAISQHHNPVFTGNGTDSVKAAVHLANIWCIKKEIGIKEAFDDEKEKSEALEVLSLKDGDMDTLFDRLEEKVEEAKIFLSE